MRVVIFGANGMLGRELVRVFSDADVLALDAAECDITDATAVQATLERARPTLIINAAAYNDVDKTEERSDVANKVNGEAVGFIVRSAEKLGSAFVHYSSDYVFDGTKKEGYREDDAPNPISAYGYSKLFGEQVLQSSLRGPTLPRLAVNARREGRGNLMYIIRLSRLFGAEGAGKRSFVDSMLELGKTKDELQIVDEEFSSPTYAPDVAQRTWAIVMTWKKESGIYHATNEGGCTWYGFAQEIFKQAKEIGILHRIPKLIPVPSTHFPRPAKRPMYSQLLNTKLPPMRPWQEALREYLLQWSDHYDSGLTTVK